MKKKSCFRGSCCSGWRCSIQTRLSSRETLKKQATKKKKFPNHFSQISKLLIFLSTNKLEWSPTAWLQQVRSNDSKEMIYAVSGKENTRLGWLEVSCTALCIVQGQLPLPFPTCTLRDRSRSTLQLHTLHFSDTVNPTEDSHTDMDSVQGLQSGRRQTCWHSAAFLASSFAEALVSFCYLFLVLKVRGVFMLVLGMSIKMPRKNLHSERGLCVASLYVQWLQDGHSCNTHWCTGYGFLSGHVIGNENSIISYNSPFRAIFFFFLTLVLKTWQWNCCYKKILSAVSLIQHSEVSSVHLGPQANFSFQIHTHKEKKKISESCWSSAPPRARPEVTITTIKVEPTSISPWELKPRWFLTQWGIKWGNQISLCGPYL